MGSLKRRVWFHRARAAVWAVFGTLSFAVGWADSIALVWAASVYANVVSDLGAAEAADDRKILDRLDHVDDQLREIRGVLDRLLDEGFPGAGVGREPGK